MAHLVLSSIVFLYSAEFAFGNAIPYLVYLINTFPIDSNLSTIDALREATAKSVNFSQIAKWDRYEEYMQDEIGTVRGFPDLGLRRLRKRRNVTLMMQVEGQLYHMQALDIVNQMQDVSESTICQANDTKIVRKMHERNIPYEFGCLTCASTAAAGNLTFFEVHRERDAFTWQSTAALRDVLFLQRHWLNNAKDSAQVYALQRHIDETNVFASSRRFDARRPAGELRVNPDMARLSNGQLNGLTVSCRSESIADQKEEWRIVMESDTLLHPNYNESTKSDGHNADRYRVGDYEAFNPDNVDEAARLAAGVVDAFWNLRLGLVWAGWSCCSACCMEKLRGRICRSIESHRSRVGYVSWRKVDIDQPLNVSKSYYAKFCLPPPSDKEPDEPAILACVKGVAYAVTEFDRRLSTSVLRDVGVPIFSTFFHANASRLILEKTLNERFKYREEHPAVNGSRSDTYPYGAIGQYVQVEQCGRYNPQRVHCVELERCVQQQDADRMVGDGLYYEVLHSESPPSYSFDDELDDEEEAVTTDPLLEHCRDIGFHEVPVYDQFAAYDVMAGASYLFVVDKPTFGSLSAANWTFSRDLLPDVDRSLPCRGQRRFSSDGGRRLAIVDLQEADTTQPYTADFIANFLNPDDGRPTSERLNIRLDLILMRRPTESKTQSQLLLWVGLLLIVMLFLVAFAVGFNLFSQRKTEFKLREEVTTELTRRRKRRPAETTTSKTKTNKKEDDTMKDTLKANAKRALTTWVIKQILD